MFSTAYRPCCFVSERRIWAKMTVRRRAAIDEIFHEDAVFYMTQKAVYFVAGRDDRNCWRDKSTHPDFEYQPLFPSR